MTSGAKKEVYWKLALGNDDPFEDEVIDKEFDVLVIGGGVVGLSAARTARDNNLSVAVIDKGHIGENSAVSTAMVINSFSLFPNDTHDNFNI
ncbi:MAG: FAD-dependent oxidoreductase [Candidatus Paceibacterota bacterium]